MLKQKYLKTFITAKRGVRKRYKEIFSREYVYRFAVFMACHHNKLIEVKQKTRQFSDGGAVLTFDDGLYSRLFSSSLEQANIIEEDILAVLETTPLQAV
ncbi:hypothetical protein ROLI_029370 [Roseobacter fucihabitans]|uniref:Uncharacterized protein n=1 Tax=Roseobacter fucihabitans TaxID=1537242 RepID=A0ABZ2BXE2_9RHOB|nr:hypothetical protein [Roseobacter litoralis]MBC6964855.1 hypothetical protein [Roseobacter litoralis]